ncbi:MAG TPA: MarR family winged helix-turn-helix transcriptional regulator [Armatimonadota bacterium]|jgi:DNA-binding MarR family transcriptional regulator
MSQEVDEDAVVLEAMFKELARRIFHQGEGQPIEELPLGQMRVCYVLSDGPHSLSCVAGRLGASASSITQMADRLERAGWVERVPEADDRRVKLLRLTPHGEGMMRAQRDLRRRQMGEALVHLTEGQRRKVMEAFQTLSDACGISGAAKRYGAASCEGEEVTG